MDTVKQIFNFFNKEYGLLSNLKRRLFLIIGVAFLGTLILILFRPFGLARFEYSDRVQLLLKYVFSSLIVWFLYLELVNKFLIKKYTILNSLIIVFFMIVISGLTTVLSWASHFSYWELNSSIIVNFQLMVIFSVFIPLFVIIIIHSNYTLYKKLKGIKTEVQTQPKVKLTFFSKEQNKAFEFNRDDILYIQSQDNYIKITFLVEDILNNKLIRSTLSQVEEDIKIVESNIFRCHNSYIVNMDYVDKIKGNSAKCFIRLKNTSNEIPVSRKYYNQILEFK